jgi:hypothetical protein
MLQDSEINVQALDIEPYVLVDQQSTTNFYIGTSRSFNDPAAHNWRIKRIWQVGNVWKSGFPGGDQGFTFAWDDRVSYVYS